MNERIKELAEQAGMEYHSEHQFDAFSEEKFALLIVKETLLVISRTPGLYKAEEVDGMIKCFNHVEKHFGVE